MNDYFYHSGAFIVVRQHAPDTKSYNETINPKLLRTVQYCLDHDLKIYGVHIYGTYTTGAFCDFINSALEYDKQFAVVFSNKRELNLDTDDLVMLNALYTTGKIRIHLADEDIALHKPSSRFSDTIWQQATGKSPEWFAQHREKMVFEVHF